MRALRRNRLRGPALGAALGLGLGSSYTGSAFWPIARRKPALQTIDDAGLLPLFWQFSQDGKNRFDSMRLGSRMLLQRSCDVRVITNATGLHINTDATASTVRSIEVRHLEDGRRVITARTIILCAGGIENARLLLASNRVAPRGLGKEQDLVGRFLMDHPPGSVVSFDPRAYKAMRQHFGLHNMPNAAGSHLFCQACA